MLRVRQTKCSITCLKYRIFKGEYLVAISKVKVRASKLSSPHHQTKQSSNTVVVSTRTAIVREMEVP